MLSLTTHGCTAKFMAFAYCIRLSLFLSRQGEKTRSSFSRNPRHSLQLSDHHCVD
uniref:Uncharacterized protein n=1 Tax=Anguilla anguilla TaxID=7936 RepID=A0A0E9UHR6_ANGAN